MSQDRSETGISWIWVRSVTVWDNFLITISVRRALCLVRTRKKLTSNLVYCKSCNDRNSRLLIWQEIWQNYCPVQIVVTYWQVTLPPLESLQLSVNGFMYFAMTHKCCTNVNALFFPVFAHTWSKYLQTILYVWCMLLRVSNSGQQHVKFLLWITCYWAGIAQSA
jgi:hypothetical protein